MDENVYSTSHLLQLECRPQTKSQRGTFGERDTSADYLENGATGRWKPVDEGIPGTTLMLTARFCTVKEPLVKPKSLCCEKLLTAKGTERGRVQTDLERLQRIDSSGVRAYYDQPGAKMRWVATTSCHGKRSVNSPRFTPTQSAVHDRFAVVR